MCGTGGNDCCCPDAVIFTEELCGNIGEIDLAVWTAPEVNDYIQGTFEVFNAGTGQIDFSINGGEVITVPPGTSQSVSINTPTTFVVQTIFSNVYSGGTGKWCITLYKRVFA